MVPEIRGNPALGRRVAPGMRMLPLLGWLACAGLLAGCGGAVGRPVPPITSSAGAGSSPSGGPDCVPSGELPGAAVVADLSRRDPAVPVTMRAGQTLRVQAEQGCNGRQWDVVSDSSASTALVLVRSGGVSGPGRRGTTWALYRADRADTVVLDFGGGAFCDPGEACPQFRLDVRVTVAISP